MRLVLVGAMSALLLAGAAAASGASHVRLVVVPSTVSPGAAVRVVGNAGPCPAGSTIFAISKAFPGRAYGEGTLTGRIGARAAFAIRGHVGATVKPGRYAVTARCGGGNLGVAAFVRIR